MSPLDAAAALLAAAFAVALGFHRHRAAQLCGLLALLALGLGASSMQHREAALRLTPWLLLACVLMPEPRLLSRRHAALVGVVALLVLVALYAPPRMLAMPVALAALPLFGLDPARGAALLLALAAFASGLRWLRDLQPLDAALGVVLIVAAPAMVQPAYAATWLIVAAAMALLGVLYASYRMAFIDPLTGLPNRRSLDEALARLSGEYALAMVDIDHFKAFNDSHGHDAGDVVLRAVGASLKRHAGGEVYRYGGEEFSVIYPALGAGDALKRLEQARRQVEGDRIALPARRRGRGGKPGAPSEARVTLSGGVAARNGRKLAATAVLKTADQALYRAKEKGRNRIERG